MPRYQRKPDIEAAPMIDETILYNPAARQFCVLNPTAAFVWEQLTQPATVDALAAGVRERFSVAGDIDVSADVRTVLRHFGDLQLVAEVAES